MSTPSKALAYIANLEAQGVSLPQFFEDFEPVGGSIWNGLLLCKYVYIDNRNSIRLTDFGMWKHAQIQAEKDEA